MATRATLRAQVRDRLSDPAISGLWTDAQLNTALANAAGKLGTRIPAAAATSPVIAAGATSTALPAGATTIARVVAPTGEAIDQNPAPMGRPSPYERLTWRLWANSIQFSRALYSSEAGTWSIEYRAPRVMPADDVTVLDWPDTLLPALSAYAAADAFQARLVDDAKRSNKTLPNQARIVADLRREAIDIVESHRRRAVGGVLA